MADLQATDPEHDIRSAFEAGDLQTTARLTLERYGREVLTFVCARMRSDDHGQEAFAMFTEDLWNGLPSFGWRCSMRCWAYVLARNAAKRFASAPARQRERNLPLSQHQSQLAEHETVRPKTAPHRDTSVKERMRALRDKLSAEEQLLLVLHVDRRLTWPEIALVLHDAEGVLDSEAQAREAARLRKRFERLKVELRRLAVEDGLLRR